MKATAATIDGVEHMIFKDPKTDSGEKKSAKGRLIVSGDGSVTFPYRVVDQLSSAQHKLKDNDNALRLVWRNGVFHKRQTVDEVRARLHPTK
jgi:nicotinamide phosphoribosyltransferase